MLLRSILIVFSLSLVMACQSDTATTAKKAAAEEVFDTATKPLFVRFYLRYLDRDKRLKSTVNFYQNNNNVQQGIEIPYGITIDERNMKFKNLNDIELRYENLYDVDAKESFDFQFKGLDGKAHTYTAKLPIVKRFAVKTDIKKKTGFTLEVEGEALSEKEVLLLMFTDGDRHTETITLFGPMDLSKEPISASAVKNLTLGRNELRLIRKNTMSVKEKTYSGICNAEYYSEPIFVEVVE